MNSSIYDYSSAITNDSIKLSEEERQVIRNAVYRDSIASISKMSPKWLNNIALMCRYSNNILTPVTKVMLTIWFQLGVRASLFISVERQIIENLLNRMK